MAGGGQGVAMRAPGMPQLAVPVLDWLEGHPQRLRWLARIVAMLLAALCGWGLLREAPQLQVRTAVDEPAPFIDLAPVVSERLPPPVRPRPESPKQQHVADPDVPAPASSAPIPFPDRPTPPVAGVEVPPTAQSGVAIPAPVSGQATGPAASDGAPVATESAPAPAARPSGLLRGMARSAACEDPDIRRRPPDCPPPGPQARQEADAARLARDPNSMPARTRAEDHAQRAAGWRDRCELESGRQADVCITFGYVPPPPRTVTEICQRAGIGGNCAPAPSQEAVERARAQGDEVP